MSWAGERGADAGQEERGGAVCVWGGTRAAFLGRLVLIFCLSLPMDFPKVWKTSTSFKVGERAREGGKEVQRKREEWGGGREKKKGRGHVIFWNADSLLYFDSHVNVLPPTHFAWIRKGKGTSPRKGSLLQFTANQFFDPPSFCS